MRRALLPSTLCLLLLGRVAAGAATWEPVAPAPAHGALTALAAAPGASGVLYAGTLAGEVLRSDDGGDGWRRVATAERDAGRRVEWLFVPPRNADVVYRSLRRPWPNTTGTEVSRDGGATWTRAGTGERLLAVHPTSPDTLYAHAGVSTDGGRTWARPEVVSTRPEAAWVHPSHPDTAMLGGYRTVDGGVTWAWVNLGPGAVAFAHDPSDPDRLYAATPGGVSRSLDAGATWRLLATGSARAVVDVAVVPDAPERLFAVRLGEGWRGELLRSDDGGNTWEDISPALTGSTYAGDRPVQVEALASGRLVVRTEIPEEEDRYDLRGRGFLYGSDDGGRSWRRLGAGLLDRPEMEQAEWGWAGDRRVWYARSTAGLFRRSAGDDGWTRLLRGAAQSVSVGRSDADVIAFLEDTGNADRPARIRLSRDGGDTWETHELPSEAHGPPQVAPGDADVIYVGRAPRLVVSTDRGRTWQQRGFLGYGEVWVGPHDTERLLGRYEGRENWLVSADGGRTWEAAAGLDSLEGLTVAASPTDARLLYAGYRYVGEGLSTYPDAEQLLFRSVDRGRRWAPVATRAGLQAFRRQLVVYPDAPEVLLAAGAEDVLLSRDGGRSWGGAGDAPVASVLSVLVEDAAAGRLLAATEDGLYRLDLGGPPEIRAPVAVASHDTARAAGTWAHPLALRTLRALAAAPDGRVWFVAGDDAREGRPGYVRGDSVAYPEAPAEVARRFKGDLALDPAGGVWCGTAWYDGARWVDRTPVNADSMARVYTDNLVALEVRAGGEVWGKVIDDCYGSDGTIAIFGGERGLRAEWRYGTAMTAHLAGGAYVNAIEEAPDGSLWIGTGADHCHQSGRGGGLTRFDGETWRYFGLQEGLPHPYVQDLAVATDGTVWASGPGGVTRFAPPYDRGTAFTADNSALPSSRVRALAVDDSSALWIGHDAGVSRFADDHWTNYTVATGLPSADVRALAVDGANRIWVATDAGLSVLQRTPTAPVRLTPEEPDEPAEPDSTRTFTLGPSYPNPSRGTARIPFSLVTSGPVEVRLYNMAGQPVRTLLDEVRPAGPQTTTWDGTAADGTPVAAGIYLCRLRGPDGERTRRLVLLR